MLKITGFDKLQREISDAQAALKSLEDGELCTVQFDPHDPASIERAIQEVERVVDERLGAYSTNAIIAPMIDEMKEKYRGAIVERAAEERASPSQGDA